MTNLGPIAFYWSRLPLFQHYRTALLTNPFLAPRASPVLQVAADAT